MLELRPSCVSGLGRILQNWNCSVQTVCKRSDSGHIWNKLMALGISWAHNQEQRQLEKVGLKISEPPFDDFQSPMHDVHSISLCSCQNVIVTVLCSRSPRCRSPSSPVSGTTGPFSPKPHPSLQPADNSQTQTNQPTNHSSVRDILGRRFFFLYTQSRHPVSSVARLAETANQTLTIYPHLP